MVTELQWYIVQTIQTVSHKHILIHTITYESTYSCNSKFFSSYTACGIQGVHTRSQGFSFAGSGPPSYEPFTMFKNQFLLKMECIKETSSHFSSELILWQFLSPICLKSSFPFWNAERRKDRTRVFCFPKYLQLHSYYSPRSRRRVFPHVWHLLLSFHLTFPNSLSMLHFIYNVS